jgi:hypothetical protein
MTATNSRRLLGYPLLNMCHAVPDIIRWGFSGCTEYRAITTGKIRLCTTKGGSITLTARVQVVQRFSFRSVPSTPTTLGLIASIAVMSATRRTSP